MDMLCSLWVILHDLGSIPNQQTRCVRIAQSSGGASRCRGIACRQLLDELRDGHPVLMPDGVEQSERVVLGDVACGREGLVLVLTGRRRR